MQALSDAMDEPGSVILRPDLSHSMSTRHDPHVSIGGRDDERNKIKKTTIWKTDCAGGKAAATATAVFLLFFDDALAAIQITLVLTHTGLSFGSTEKERKEVYDLSRECPILPITDHGRDETVQNLRDSEVVALSS